MKYSTVIFDMDGTILNTLDDLHDSVNYALEKMGYPLRSLDEIRSFVGNGVEVLIRRSVPKGTDEKGREQCRSFFREHYSVNMNNKTRPYEGIVDLIKALRQRGYKTAVVSNKSEYAVIELCKQTFPDLFDVIVGQTQERSPKPAPDGVFYALDKLGIRKSQAVYVGDSDVDVQTALNSGLDCIGVTWGFRDRAVLEKAGAKYIIDKAGEMLNIIR